MRRRALAFVVLAGCGRIGFDDSSQSGTGDAAVDTIDAPPPCATTVWGAPVRQTALATPAEDWEPALHPDGLVLVYIYKPGQLVAELRMATRPDLTSNFGAPTTVLPGGYEAGPFWSKDGTKLYFNRDDGSTFGLRVADWNGVTFTNDRSAPSPADSFSGDMSADGLELFYTTVKGNLDYDIGHATRANTGDAWTPDDDLISLVRDSQSEGWPVLDEARQQVWMEYDVVGGAEIVTIERAARGAPWNFTLKHYPQLGEGGDPDVSRDGLTMVFGSQRGGGAGGNDIYMSTRTCQ